nr:hypothetical protein GCM10020093_035550 [Planobispora longispora]
MEPPAAETVRRSRHVEMSGIVQIDAIGREEMSRLSNTLMAAVAVRPYGDGNLRVETVYDEERGSMKIIILGGLDDAAELLKIINTLVKEPA